MSKLIVTTSWDDGTISGLKLAELIDKRGIKGTFYIPRSPRHNLLQQGDIVALDRKFESNLLPFCRESNIGVLAYSSIAKGLLTGKYDRNTRFELGDHRSRVKYFHGEAFLKNLKIVERVKVIAKRLNKTPAQIALRWVLENPCVRTAVFGAKNTAQVEENVVASDFVLPKEDIELSNNLG